MKDCVLEQSIGFGVGICVLLKEVNIQWTFYFHMDISARQWF